MKTVSTKRVISLLLTLAMLLGMFPVVNIPAVALEANTVAVTPNEGDPIQKSDAYTGDGWEWDPTTATLTLNGFSGKCITVNGDVTLVLKGTNTINMIDNATDSTFGIGGRIDYLMPEFHVYGEENAVLNVIGNDLEETNVYGIYGGLYMHSGTVNVNITCNSNKCTGVYGGVIYEEGYTGKVDVSVESSYANGYVYGHNNGSVSIENCENANVSFVAKGTETSTVTAISVLSVYKSNANVTAEADNDGGPLSLRRAVDELGNIDLTGGKLDFTGKVRKNSVHNFYINEHVISTIPADNQYTWLDVNAHPSIFSYEAADVNGNTLDRLVLEYSVEPAKLDWVGDNTIEIPGGVVGSDSATYIIAGLRGTSTSYGSQYSSGVQFYVHSGSLPAGMGIDYAGSIGGTVTEACPAGSVEIKAVDRMGTQYDSTDDREITFTLNYGAYVEPDRYITVNNTQLEMRTNGSGTGWSYNGETKTLTLNNYTGGPIIAEKDFDLYLIGDNTINISEVASGTYAGIYTYINGSMCTIDVTAETNATLNITGSDLTSYTYGIYGHTNFHSGTVNVSISGTSYNSCGIYGTVDFKENDTGTINIDINNTSTEYAELRGFGSGSLNIENCQDVTINVDVKGKEEAVITSIDILNVSSSSVNITATADNSGGPAKYRKAVGYLYHTLLTGGKIDLKGTVKTSRIYESDTSRHVVSTTPADNQYIWRDIDNPHYEDDLFACNTNGDLLDRLVLEYSNTPASLKWLGGNIFTVPEGNVGDNYLLYLLGFLRGVSTTRSQSYYYGVTFEVIEGSLPTGLYISTYDSSIAGKVSAPCVAGSVTIKATDRMGTSDTADDTPVQFTVNYGKISSNIPPESVTLNKSEIILECNENTTLTATVFPDNAAFPNVIASSSAPNIVDISKVYAPIGTSTDIALHGVTPGVATVTVTTQEMGHTNTATVYVKEIKPNIYIDYRDEYLRGFETGEDYVIKADGADDLEFTAAGNYIEIDPTWIGKTLNIIKANAEEKCNSTPLVLEVPQRPAAPAVGKQDASSASAMDGMITNYTDAMEYQKEGASSWSSYIGTVITGLPIGTYYIRYRATSSTFTGLAATVVISYGELAFADSDAFDIPAGNAGESMAGYSVLNSVSGGSPAYTFSKVSGPEWITVSTSGYISGERPSQNEAAAELVIKVTDSASAEKTITVKVGAVSLISVNEISATLNYYDLESNISSSYAYFNTEGVIYNGIYGNVYGITDSSKNKLNSGYFAADTDYYLWIDIKAETNYTVAGLTAADILLNGTPAESISVTDGVITAYFKLPRLQYTEYEISVTDGYASAAKAKEGASVTITANTAPAGKVFDKWVATSGEVTFANANNTSTTFTMPNSNVAVKATYKDKLYTVTVENGTSDKPSAKEGETVTVTAAAAPAHMEFEKWVVYSGSITLQSLTSPTTSFVMGNDNVTVEAQYKDIEYTVEITDGTSTPKTATIGTTVYINATEAPEHMDFDKWVVVSENVTITDPSLTNTSFVMPGENVEIKATYKDHEYNVNVSYGTASPEKAIIGTTVTITADPAPANSQFDYWHVYGDIVLNDERSATTSFIMAGSDVSITAMYKAKEYNVTVTNGTATPSVAISGTNVTVTAAAAPAEKTFDKWVVTSGNVILNNASSESTYFTMPQGDVTVEATYKDKTYAVSVSNGTSTPSTAKAGETVTVTAIDTPAGKTFGGWKVTSGNLVLDDTESKTVSFTMPSGAVSITAIFNDIECTVAFIKNGGEGTMDSAKIPYNTEYTLPSCTFTAPNGMEFKCWKINGIEKAAGDKITVTEYTAVNAVWKNKFYTVSFNANSGSGTMANASAEFSKEYTLPDCAFTAPAGKTFKCWSIGGTEMDAGDKITIEGDTAVTAIWMDIPAITYTVSFDANTGTGSMASIPGIAGQYTLPECGFTAPEGKTFKCWSVGGTEKNAGDKIAVTEDITVKAIWKDATCFISFNANGGSGSMMGENVVYNTEYTLPECGFTAPTGSSFKCWNIGGTEKAVGDKIVIKGNTSITAVWDGVPYSITFEANGGSGTMANESALYGSDFTLPACTFTAPEGKVFKCWKVGGVEKAAGDKITVNGNVTVTAVWEAITHTVSFEANGGSGVMAGSNVLHNAVFSLPECTFTAPAGKTFKCWSVGGVEKNVGDKITVSENVTITAVWADSTGCKVSGTVISYGEATANTKLELIREGETEAAYVITVNGDNDAAAKGNTAAFSFSDVENGKYTLRVSKTMHASREYEVTISEDTSIDLSILLYGDVTSDGKANAADATQIKRFYNNKNSIFATYSGEDLEYLKKVADITGEGKVNAADATQIKRYYNNKSSRFDTFE